MYVAGPDKETITKHGELNHSNSGQSRFKKIAKWIGFTITSLFAISVLLVVAFRWVNPPTSSFMLQQQIKVTWADENSPELQYKWVGWDEISDYTKVATITSEDQRFPQHNGFDFEAIQDAIKESQRGEQLRGASTITQQVAKNLFLWPGRSYLRKGIEAYFTVLIEFFWSKKRILEIYLNIAQFGRGVYGVEAASNTYFNTTAANLDMAQSALLVTALPSPSRYNLGDPSNYMIERRNWVLRYMFYLGNTSYLKQLE